MNEIDLLWYGLMALVLILAAIVIRREGVKKRYSYLLVSVAIYGMTVVLFEYFL